MLCRTYLLQQWASFDQKTGHQSPRKKINLKKTISVVSSNLRGSEKKEPVEETLIVFLLSVQEVSKGSGLYSAENTQSAVIDRYLS